MRARIGIVIMIGGIVAFAAVSKYVGAVKAGAGTHSFARYYEPCEPDISLNFTDYQLPLEVNDIINFTDAGRVTDVNSMSVLICQNGFAVTPFYSMFGDFLAVDFVDVYKTLKYMEFPSFFVTADTGLYLYRAVFDQTLRLIEESLFEPSIKDLTSVLLDDALKKYNQLEGDLQEAVYRNVAYLSVAQKLIDPNAAVPGLVKTEVNNELAKIEAHQGVDQSDIFLYAEDYSQYVPRGHYTSSDELKRYFKTMMWYGRMAFLLKGGPEGLISEHDAKIQTMQACILALSLKSTEANGRAGLDIWDRIYSITSFFVGSADDLTPGDYLSVIEKVFGSLFILSDLDDEEKMFELKKELALLPSPEIYGGTGDIIVDGPVTDETLDEVLDKTKGMRLMGRRFVPDSYVFQHLTFPEVDGYTGDPNQKPFTKDDTFGNRSYIRGLDLMAVLGSNEAMDILIDEGDTDFNNYDRRINELTEEFDSLNLEERNQNLYWSWLYCLGGLLQELPEGYPNFMRTQNWQRSRLNASLASWTQLRHDTILYGKPSNAPPPFIPHIPPGYVEPNPVFWGRLLALARMTMHGLENFDFRTDDELEISIVSRVENLEQFLQKVLDISVKQLANEPLSEEEEEFFRNLPDTLEGLAKDAHRNSPTRATLVADVHTFSLEGLVVEEAVGFVDLMVVACPLADGRAFLAAGPVFSYYEFKHPMEDRLTDGAWLNILYNKSEPDRPKWYQPLIPRRDTPSDDDGAGIRKLTDTYFDDGNPCWSPNGEKILFDRGSNIYVINTDGSGLERLTYDTVSNSDPSLSPDGEKIAFVSQSDIFTMNADGSDPQNITNSTNYEEDPCWSPDGRKIAYISTSAVGTERDYNIYVMNADGSEPKQLTDNPEFDGQPHWSSNDQKIAYTSASVQRRNFDVFIMNPDGSQKENLTNNPAYDGSPCWSSDGEKIAFRSEKNGRYYIYIMNADGTQKIEVNNSEGMGSPSWSPDSTKLVCTCGVYNSRNICIIDLE